MNPGIANVRIQKDTEAAARLSCGYELSSYRFAIQWNRPPKTNAMATSGQPTPKHVVPPKARQTTIPTQIETETITSNESLGPCPRRSFWPSVSIIEATF